MQINSKNVFSVVNFLDQFVVPEEVISPKHGKFLKLLIIYQENLERLDCSY